jgi:TolA-binding protein
MKRILCLLPLFALVACEGKREDRSKVLAKIAGTSYTQSDFEFMLKTMTPDRQAEIMKDPEARRKQFNFMLKQKLQAMAAQKSKYGKNPSLAARQDLIDKRIVTQAYYQTYLGENDGIPVAELQAFYKANAAKFVNDSGKTLPFEEVRSKVADSVVIAKAPLDSFYQATNRRYEQKAFCDLSLIQTKSRKTADEAAKAVADGLPFPEAVAKYSIHETSKANKGKIGRQVKGETIWELGAAVNPDSLFFNDATKLKVGGLSRAIKKDSTWLIVKVDSCAPQNIPALETVRKQVSDDYLAQYKTKLSDNALSSLKAKYGVKLKSETDVVSTADLQKFYDAHKENYFSPETYDVWHIESKNKDQLAKRAKDIKDLDGFKKLAVQYSENTWTKPASGQIGVIKRDHCLPDGIGMMPALFTALDTMASGLVKDPIQNPDTKKWHLFWLVQKWPKQAKAFDRVQALVKQDYKSEKTTTVKPEDTLATFKGKVVREKDVTFLREEIPAHMQDRYTREALVDYLLTWDLATLEAKSLGLLDDVKIQAQREENRVNYWGQVYQDSIVARTAGLDSLTLKKTFETNRPFFTKDSNDQDFHKYVRDVAAFLTLDPKDFDIEYRTNPERYRKDTTALSFEESRYDVFQNLKGAAYVKAEERQLDRLEREFQVVVMDPTLLPPKIRNPQEAYKQAQNLHYDRKLDQAVELYQRLRDEFPKVETLQDSICFGMAQIFIEQEKYQQALSEYRRLSYLYPKSANNYKAMFMVGFIHAEHLKNDSAAVRSFEKMLAQYPSSDLSDDADWMIRNIRSGGKLMPVLEGDTGYVAPDSTGAATAQPAKPASDSAKTAKAAVKAAKKTEPKAVAADSAKAAPTAKPAKADTGSASK